MKAYHYVHKDVGVVIRIYSTRKPGPDTKVRKTFWLPYELTNGQWQQTSMYEIGWPLLQNYEYLGSIKVQCYEKVES